MQCLLSTEWSWYLQQWYSDIPYIYEMSFIKGVHFTCTARVEPHKTRDGGRGKEFFRFCQKQGFLSLHDLSTVRHLLRRFLYNKPKVKFMHSANHRK